MYQLDNLAKLKQITEAAPEVAKAFREFDRAAFREGALSVRVKELMAVAVAVTTQCAYCIAVHTQKAREAGATDAELAEAIYVSAAIRAGGSLTHGSHCML